MLRPIRSWMERRRETRRPKPAPRGNIADRIVEIGRTITPEDRAAFPRDGARNLDHYLYGLPKQD